MFEENAELALLSRSQMNNSLHDSNHLDEDTDTGRLLASKTLYPSKF